MRKLYVGIDPSLSNTALVVINDKGIILESVNYKDTGFADMIDPDQVHIAKLDSIFHFICGWCPSNYPVAIESYSIASLNRPFTLGEVGGIVRIAAYNQQCKITDVPPLSLKRFATGHGHASKEEIVKQAISEGKDLGKDPTDDICDAYFLAKYAWYKANPKFAAKHETNRDLLRHRLECIQKGTE